MENLSKHITWTYFGPKLFILPLLEVNVQRYDFVVRFVLFQGVLYQCPLSEGVLYRCPLSEVSGCPLSVSFIGGFTQFLTKMNLE